MGVILEAIGPQIGYILALAIWSLIVYFFSGTVWKKAVKLLIAAFAKQLEDNNLNVPEVLHNVITYLHSLSGSTKELEDLIVDEEVKYKEK